MDNYYIDKVSKLMKDNSDLFKEVVLEVFGKESTFEEFKQADRGMQIKVAVLLENKIRLSDSPIDVEKLAYAIQQSRSGAGGCAMTTFICNFCGEQELWSNTAVPKICKSCATDMATKIAIYHYDIMKEV